MHHFYSRRGESDFFTKAGYKGAMAAGKVADRAAVASGTKGRVAKDTFLVSRPWVGVEGAVVDGWGE